jgi:hypothetical protein
MPRRQKASDDQLVRAFYTAALWLIDKVEREGWYWRSNYLREHVGCTTGLRFTNSRSPGILRLLGHRHPELKEWIKLKPCTRPSDDLFKQVKMIMAIAEKNAARELSQKQ